MKNLYIVHGTLGAGKTTFINNLLKINLLDKLLIIENEFASESIDASLLNTQSVLEINGKCICCNIEDDLRNILSQIAKSEEYKNVLIETTGVASLTNLLNKVFLYDFFLQNYKIIQIIMLVDLTKFEELSTNQESLVNMQLSDLLVLNKSDLVDSKLLKKIKSKVNKINQNFYVTTRSNIEYDFTLQGSEIESRFFENINKVNTTSHEDENMFYIFDQNIEIDPEKLKKVILNLGDNIERVKGYFHFNNLFFKVSYASKFLEIETSTKLKTTKIVFIGKNINTNKINLDLNKQNEN